MISGNMVGSYSQMGKTFILMDEDGNEITGVVVGQETVFTAGDNDVREGMIYASDGGVSEGTKNIPAYRTEKGYCMISDGDEFSISCMSEYNQYDYTELHCIIAPFNSNTENSVAVDKVVLYDGVYAIGSVDIISTVSKNHDTKSIDLNITNNSGIDYVIHYFTYREEV